MDPGIISLTGIALAIGVPIISAAVTIIICGTALVGIGTEKLELLSSARCCLRCTLLTIG